MERRTWLFPNNVQNDSTQYNWSKPCRTPVLQKLRTRIPGIEEFPVADQEVCDRDNETKEKGKLYADEKLCACKSDVKEGDMVLLRKERKNKLTPTFRPEPYCVVESPDGVQGPVVRKQFNLIQN